jgi:hypothetical protein
MPIPQPVKGTDKAVSEVLPLFGIEQSEWEDLRVRH